MPTDPNSPQLLNELIAAIVGFAEIEEFENHKIFEERTLEMQTSFLANAVAALRENKDLFDRVFPEDNPYLKLLRTHIEEVNKLVD